MVMATDQPIPPIFVVEDRDVGVYDSVERAAADMEPIDVHHGIYRAFDSRGRHLNISIKGAATIASLAESDPSGRSELESILREHLSYLGIVNAASAECDLPCLVELSRRSERRLEPSGGLLRRLAKRFFRQTPSD